MKLEQNKQQRWGKKRFPAATLSLILLNLLVALATLPYDHMSGTSRFADSFGFIPSSPTPSNAVTSLFIHADVFHLFANMIFLWIFTSHVESYIGFVPTLLLYLFGGIASVGTHWAITVGMHSSVAAQPLVGASGAVSAIIGYFALRFYRSGVRMNVGTHKRFSPVWIPVWVAALIWFGLQGAGALASLFESDKAVIGYWAHVGGFGFGLMVGALWRAGNIGDREHSLEQAEEALRMLTPATALNYLRPLLHCNPEDAEALLLSGHAWEQLGDTELMASDWSKGLRIGLETEQYHIAKECAHQLIKHKLLHLTPPQRLYRLGCLCFDNNASELAVSIMETLVRMPKAALERENALLKLADYYLRGNKSPERARKLLETFMEDYPASVYLNTAQSWLRQLPS